MKCTTHIGRVRQKYASNRRFILQTVGMTWEQYSLKIFEIGISFLLEHYPEDDQECGPYFKQISRDPNFWTFWKFEWIKWENELIDHAKMCEINLNYEMYIDEMQQLIMDGFTENRFYQDYQTQKLTLTT
jgi:hypothetical protein